MKIYTDCYSCLTNLALRTLRYSGADAETEEEIMQNVMCSIGNCDEDDAPITIVAGLMEEIRAKIGVDDPYEAVKQVSTQEALSQYPMMKRLVADSDDPFKTALHIAALGNSLDFAVADHFDLESIITVGIDEPFIAEDLEMLRKAIKNTSWFLMLADNAGESVCDRVLIETIHEVFGPVEVKYAVKSGGGLNDTMVKDAIEAGLDQCATLVETGDGIAGILLERSSKEFQELFRSAPVILSKGMGNYEGLSENSLNENIHYLFKVKCNSMVREINLPIGTLVLWHRNN